MMNRSVIKALADEISDALLSDLRSKKLDHVGIDEIRAAIAARVAGPGWNDPDDLEQIEDLTVRRVVMGVYYRG